ncbi:hypothetical protein HanXRQr2_Chr17g0813411 [Helianthus annuus]|uniref:Uncharacterized protein n=1 Tax=Helianthus annuus TaxID=4232 RepID=A0A9K3DKD8_HELAN|nr:hypothetical protein HanXRQr2_Chr17g0813411 [Helianthus annuus]
MESSQGSTLVCFEDGVWTFPFWAQLSLIFIFASFIVSEDQVPWLESFVLNLLVVVGFHFLLIFGFLDYGLISGFF